MKSTIVAVTHSFRTTAQILLAFLVFTLSTCLPFNTSAQTTGAMAKVQQYLSQHKSALGLSEQDVSDLQITDTYTDQHNGLTHIYVQQRHNGLAIKNALLGLHLDRSGNPVYTANQLVTGVQLKAAAREPAIEAAKAVAISAKSLGLQPTAPVAIISRSNQKNQQTLLSKSGISQKEIPAKLLYYPAADGSLKLAWEVEIYTLDAGNYWVATIDATTGDMLEATDLVIKCNFNHNHAAADCKAGQIAHVPAADHHFFSGEKENIRTIFAKNTALSGNFYRVYEGPIETPNHGGRTFVSTSGDPVASPFGWHNDGTVSYVITKGNNVHAYEDQLGANAGTSPVGGIIPGQSLFFDFPLDLNQAPAAYTEAAVTNLFFWNNYIHDVMYGYGFTEVAGNFQTDNLSRGGLGGDAIMAEAQDGGGTNNANFLTLPDGIPGRMQMYLWSSNSPAEVVHIESSATYPNGEVSFTGIPAAFGAEVTTTGVTGELVLVESNVNSVSTCNPCGCGTGQGVGLPPNNNVQGKIVLIDRGDCSFIEKAMGAQMGGAIGIIVANNIPGAGPIAMGGDETGNAILIPAVMISFEDGLELKDEIALGTITTSIRRDTPAPPNKDGDLDNGIIVHEYGHGISIRLTGGPSTGCLSGQEQAGEGWSDYFALMLTMDPATIGTIAEEGRGIGSYILDEPVTGGGIRPAKYSTSFAVNDFTYADIGRSDILAPHGVGFVFCTALWEMTWNLIDAYGYDEDITSGDLTKGNILALQLVIDGLKLQPCSPTFLESRDAILAADQALTGGANQCLIWEAFAKRGMGFSAQSGSNSKGDEVEKFDLPLSCFANVKIAKSAPLQNGNGQAMTYTISLTNTGSETAHGVTTTDPLPAGVDFVSASNGGVLTGNTVIFPSIDLAPGQSTVYTIEVVVNTPTTSTLQFADNMEDGINLWSRSTGLNTWTYSNANARSGNFAWFAADPDNLSEQTLQLASPVTLSPGAELRFWHRYNTESGFDGGVVELTNDGGLTWYDLGPLMTKNGYSDFIPASNNPMINGFAFGGNSGEWIETVVNLSLYQNQQINVRFRFSSDVATPGEGWYVDDVVIGSSITTVENTASFVTLDGETGASSVTTLVTNSAQSLAGNPNHQTTPNHSLQETAPGFFAMTAYPNPAKDQINLRLEGAVAGEVQLRVLNAHGQSVMQIKRAQEEVGSIVTLNTSQLSSGLYFIQYQDGSNARTVRVFISRE